MVIDAMGAVHTFLSDSVVRSDAFIAEVIKEGLCSPLPHLDTLDPLQDKLDKSIQLIDVERLVFPIEGPR